MPRLKIMDTDRLNAFATGLSEKQYAITVTRGLLAALDDAELEAVLAHELTHIRNEDVRMMVTAVDHRRRDLVLRRARLPLARRAAALERLVVLALVEQFGFARRAAAAPSSRS